MKVAILIQGPRYVGKTEVAKRICGNHVACNPQEKQSSINSIMVNRVRTLTTRRPRRDESDPGYLFVDTHAFQNYEDAGEVLESVVYDGYKYGTYVPELEFLSRTVNGCVNIPCIVATPSAYKPLVNAGYSVIRITLLASMETLVPRMGVRGYEVIQAMDRANSDLQRFFWPGGTTPEG